MASPESSFTRSVRSGLEELSLSTRIDNINRMRRSRPSAHPGFLVLTAQLSSVRLAVSELTKLAPGSKDLVEDIMINSESYRRSWHEVADDDQPHNLTTHLSHSKTTATIDREEKGKESLTVPGRRLIVN